MNPLEESTYLGVDFSTQQLKGVILDNNLKILQQTQVQFDNDLPEYRTSGGVISEKDGHTVTAPTIMWVKALDMLLDKLRLAGADFTKLAAISGTAQQHGSVYWQTGAQKMLQSLQPDKFLHQQLSSSFSVQHSPVWMDSSTTEQCLRLERAVGGPQALAEITGSRAYQRFTGHQIAKLHETKQTAYKNTERISLVSSFACSLFLGDYAPIDYSDSSGMNLLDIRSKEWSQPCLQSVAPDLGPRLADPVPPHSVVGPVSKYLVERFDFNPDCKVVAFTGDNPASLVGMCLKPGDIAVSLGTSDTMFLWLEKPQTFLQGHVLCNPVDKDAYMALLCFKNGSLTRERIRDTCAGASWEIFNELLDSTPRGNFGNMGLFYDVQEIVPFVSGNHRRNKANDEISRFTSREVEVRALLEGQFLAKRAHAQDLGFTIGKDTRILATGGASNNMHILQVLADVFNAPVYTLEAANSAVLGAAFQAKFALVENEMSFVDMTACLGPPSLACAPYKDADWIYTPMVARYRAMISAIAESQSRSVVDLAPF